MTQPPSPTLPPFGDATDEALSALLDGELAAFASDQGLSEPEVQARLEAWPGYAARRAELEAVRGTIGTSTPPLDDLTRRRLIRTALPAGPGRLTKTRTWSWQRVTAAAAAALILLAGFGSLIATMDGEGSQDLSSSGGSASSADAPTGGARELRGDVGDLGDVTDPATLRALLDPDPGEEAAAAPKTPPTAGGLSKQNSGADGGTTGNADQSESALRYDAARRAVDPNACAAQLAGDRPVTFVGTGTYQGRPVTIVGLTQDGRTIAFVVADADCTTPLTSISR
jgi:hypothetical protein